MPILPQLLGPKTSSEFSEFSGQTPEYVPDGPLAEPFAWSRPMLATVAFWLNEIVLFSFSQCTQRSLLVVSCVRHTTEVTRTVTTRSTQWTAAFTTRTARRASPGDRVSSRRISASRWAAEAVSDSKTQQRFLWDYLVNQIYIETEEAEHRTLSLLFFS